MARPHNSKLCSSPGGRSNPRRMAVLLPAIPSADLVALLQENKIGLYLRDNAWNLRQRFLLSTELPVNELATTRRTDSARASLPVARSREGNIISGPGVNQSVRQKPSA
jgi:hypothetical protein